MVERRNPACLVTAPPLQERRSVTNHGVEVEEHNYASDAEAIRYWATRLYEAQTDHIRGGSIFVVLGPVGVLQRLGVKQDVIDTVIRASSRRLPFPFDLFQDQAA